MGRTVQSSYWDARRRAAAVCLVAVGWVPLFALVGGQTPRDKIVVTIQKPSLLVHLSLLPAEQASEFELRVRTEPAVKTPPEVEFQDMAGGMVRAVKIVADAKSNTWVGTISDTEPFGVGYIHVSATGDSGVAERHELRYATRGTVKNQPSVLYSVDGQFAFVVLPGGLAADTRFVVTTLELPDPPLPAGVKLEAGPFEIMATQLILDKVTASVAIRLAAPSPNGGSPPSYQMRWLKPGGVAWEVLPATIGSDGRVAQAGVFHLGTFVLTSESK